MRRWNIIALGGVAAIGIMGFGLSRKLRSGDFSDSPAAVKMADAKGANPIEEALLKEFEGSYAEITPSGGRVVEYEFSAAPAVQEIYPGYQTQVWAYDGQVPGPTIRMRLGDTLRVKFTNSIPQATTIHWHGVRVPNAMDGVPGVTQPAIEPGASFVYEFTPKDAGTFWFHPHHNGSEQLERGLYAALIVEEAEASPFDRELVWILDDWLLQESGQIYDKFVTPHDLGHDGRWGNLPSVNASFNPTYDVDPGERIRLRLINAANGRIFAPDFSEFGAQGIAFDGMASSRPFDPTGYVLTPGNRLDLDITIPVRLRGKEVAIADHFTRQAVPLAILRVKDADLREGQPKSPPASAKVPAWTKALEAPIHTEFALDARQGGEHGVEWLMLDPLTGRINQPTLTKGRFHRVRFSNRSYRLHPMHLHGQFFKLLARNGQPIDEPHWRDTVLVGSQETVDIGLVPLDAGEWMAHCHIQEHHEAGMMTVIKVQ